MKGRGGYERIGERWLLLGGRDCAELHVARYLCMESLWKVGREVLFLVLVGSIHRSVWWEECVKMDAGSRTQVRGGEIQCAMSSRRREDVHTSATLTN
jgi:hypothetical protein